MNQYTHDDLLRLIASCNRIADPLLGGSVQTQQQWHKVIGTEMAAVLEGLVHTRNAFYSPSSHPWAEQVIAAHATLERVFDEVHAKVYRWDMTPDQARHIGPPLGHALAEVAAKLALLAEDPCFGVHL